MEYKEYEEKIEKEKKEMLEEVNSYGYDYTCINDLLKIGKTDKILIPVLLKWIEKFTEVRYKIILSDSLAVKGYTEATLGLIKLFRYLKGIKPADRWAVGNTIGEIGDKRYVDEYIKLIREEEVGNRHDLQMIVYYMSRYKEEKVKQVLIELLDDESVNGHAINALGKFKDVKLIEKIEPFLKHGNTWKRKEAKSAIARLEKLKEKTDK